MKKINWKKLKDIINIEYVLLFQIIIMLILILSVVIFSKNDVTKTLIETSNLKTTSMLNKSTSASNYNIEILDYSILSYYIKVNIQAQTVTIYTQDDTGEFTIPVKSMICSTGTSTPENGVYEISDKYEWRYLVGDVYGQYATRITGQILFHSVPYTDMDKSTLKYKEYDKLGQAVSKGCVRLTVEDAKWIYDYCKEDTKVEFYSDKNPGPLGQPQELKISNYSKELRKWDPTDPDENNPWKDYIEEVKGESK